MIQLNYRDEKPIYEQIKDGLRKLVITNSLIANEKLPSVREMASKLAINPNTIQKAYRELEAEGYVYTVAGKGTFVAERKEVLGVIAKIPRHASQNAITKGDLREQRVKVRACTEP